MTQESKQGLKNSLQPKDTTFTAVAGEKLQEKITPTGIKAEVESLKAKAESLKYQKGLFVLKSANKWIDEAKRRPIPKMMIDEFWFEGELCFLFADTGAGKTILAVQIANDIAEKQKVLYLDFELSDKQFEARYSNNYTNHYRFNENFYRVEIAPDIELPEGVSFEEYLYTSLETSINDTGAKVVFVDNITFLKDETEKAKSALPLMKMLKALKRKYNLSILALAHTPKRDISKPISRNDLAGSKMLINFSIVLLLSEKV